MYECYVVQFRRRSHSGARVAGSAACDELRFLYPGRAPSKSGRAALPRPRPAVRRVALVQRRPRVACRQPLRLDGGVAPTESPQFSSELPQGPRPSAAGWYTTSLILLEAWHELGNCPISISNNRSPPIATNFYSYTFPSFDIWKLADDLYHWGKPSTRFLAASIYALASSGNSKRSATSRSVAASTACT